MLVGAFFANTPGAPAAGKSSAWWSSSHDMVLNLLVVTNVLFGQGVVLAGRQRQLVLIPTGWARNCPRALRRVAV
eukprot:12932250-Prorocentrum_lima.AAC.1